MSRICVKNLGKSTTEKQLKELFGTKGEVTDVRIVKTKSGKSRQLAFLGFRTDIQADEAINYFNNTFLETARIIVESAKKIGDQTLIDTTRSKITKKKLEKAAKLQSAEASMLHSKSKIATKKVSHVKELPSKEKRDFMEAMKPRRNTQFWANDESLPSTLAATDELEPGSKDENGYPDDDNDSDADDNVDDINDFSNPAPSNDTCDTSAKRSKADKSTSVLGAKEPKTISSGTADLDFLRSKVKAHFSDDEADESGDDQMNRVEISDKIVPDGVVMDPEDFDADQEEDIEEERNGDDNDDSGRLFIRNLTFSCSEDELKVIFSVFGPVTAVHLPLDSDKKSKGFGFVQFVIPEQALKARDALDGSSFQGRLLHIINAKKAPEIVTRDPDSGHSKLSSFQQKKEDNRKKMANKTEGWNASFVRSDAVVDSLADR